MTSDKLTKQKKVTFELSSCQKQQTVLEIQCQINKLSYENCYLSTSFFNVC